MHFKDIKGVASMNKSKKKKIKKKIKYMKNGNIMIKTNIHIQHFLTDFAIRRAYRTNYTFSINALNLKVKVSFSQILPPGLRIIRGLFT